MSRRLLVAIGAVIALGLGACGDDATSSASTTAGPTTTQPAGASTTAPPTTAARLEGAVTVMAPGPFKALLEAAATEFRIANPGVSIELNLGHVPTLLTQLQSGVSAEILVTPDATTMTQATSKGLTTTAPTVFAKVPFALVVPAGNAAGVTGVDALAKGELRVAVCAAELPCGALANELATKAGIAIKADTMETGGSPGVVTKASTGEIDVGLAFATDIAAGGAKVAKIAIPDAVNVSSSASIAPLKAGKNATAAAAFIAFLTSKPGLGLVTAKGFLAP